MATLLDCLLVLVAGAALGWTAIALRFYVRLKSFWPIEPTHGDQVEQSPLVDAIVAARNEEAHIAETIASLRSQDYPRLNVTIVDDQSTDSTSSILRSLARDDACRIPLRAVQGVDRPEGWVGKTWALHQGVTQSSADWLLFIDADMRLHPRALTTAWHHAHKTGADLVSLLPRPECSSFWQGAVALAVVQLLSHRFPLDLVNHPRRSEALASGGFILVRRKAYERAGGHTRLRRAIMDDIELARRVKQAGGKLAVMAAPELARTHMYGSLRDIWQGLRKNAYAVMNYRFYKYAIGSIFGLILVWGPVLALVGFVAEMMRGDRSVNACLLGALGLWALLAQGLASYPFVRFLRLPVAMSLSAPAGLTLYIAIATSSVWHHVRGRVLWKGRSFSTRTVKTRTPYQPADSTAASNIRAEGPQRMPTAPHLSVRTTVEAMSAAN